MAPWMIVIYFTIGILIFIGILVFALGTSYRIVEENGKYKVQKEKMNGWEDSFMNIKMGCRSVRMFESIEGASEALRRMLIKEKKDNVVGTLRINVFGKHYKGHINP